MTLDGQAQNWSENYVLQPLPTPTMVFNPVEAMARDGQAQNRSENYVLQPIPIQPILPSPGTAQESVFWQP